MKHSVKKLALALTLVSAVTAGGYVSARAVAPQQEKQTAFEEHLTQKEAAFEREYNEVKLRNDEIRRKFDSLPSPSESELRDALARSLNK